MDENLCPDCGSKMLSRKNRQSGESFWGCTKYPECKGTRDNMGRSKAERLKEKEKENYDKYNPSEGEEGFRFNRNN